MSKEKTNGTAGATAAPAGPLKKVKVRLSAEHLHNGAAYKKGDELELPEDLAEFVVKNKKGTIITA